MEHHPLSAGEAPVAPVKADQLAVVLLLSGDPGRTAAFYRDVIGLDLQAEEHDSRHPHYACRTGSVYFTIQFSGDFPAPPPAMGRDSLQLCFSVPDLTAFLEHLHRRGVAPLHPPQPFEHTTFLTLRDPDGRTLRVMTPWVA